MRVTRTTCDKCHIIINPDHVKSYLLKIKEANPKFNIHTSTLVAENNVELCEHCFNDLLRVLGDYGIVMVNDE